MNLSEHPNFFHILAQIWPFLGQNALYHSQDLRGDDGHFMKKVAHFDALSNALFAKHP